MSMDAKIKLTESTQRLLRCPICKSKLILDNCQLKCMNIQCATCFPIVDGIPILIDELSSIFSISDFINFETTNLRPKTKIERLMVNLLPGISLNINSKTNYEKLAKMLLNKNEAPKILVIGGSIVGQGMEAILSFSSIELIGSDVCFGPCTALICDSHDIPFDNSSFDGVIIQAVLEHVVDPYRCVEEIHRVLKEDGLVYAETPFMAQVHLGKYDFTRFSHLGHRYLFRKFEEICSGAVCGPGMALSWSYQYFLLSFVKAQAARAFIKIFARLTSFWLKYFDYYLIDKPGSFDAALGYYFIGKKSNRVLSSRELIKLYRGAQLSSF